MPLTPDQQRQYNVAKLANQRLEAELARVYRGRARRMRSKPQDWTDPKLIAAARVYDRLSSAAFQTLLRARNPFGKKRKGPRAGRVPNHLRPYLFKRKRR